MTQGPLHKKRLLEACYKNSKKAESTNKIAQFPPNNNSPRVISRNRLRQFRAIPRQIIPLYPYCPTPLILGAFFLVRLKKRGFVSLLVCQETEVRIHKGTCPLNEKQDLNPKPRHRDLNHGAQFVEKTTEVRTHKKGTCPLNESNTLTQNQGIGLQL